jgi:hypothetical protein
MGNAGYARADDRASGGATPYRFVGLAATGQVVKAAGGRVYGYDLHNSGASAAYVKIYNKATAPTQADTPIRTIHIPAAGSKAYTSNVGIAFPLGISCRAVTEVADSGTTAPGANEVIVHIDYA